LRPEEKNFVSQAKVDSIYSLLSTKILAAVVPATGVTCEGVKDAFENLFYKTYPSMTNDTELSPLLMESDPLIDEGTFKDYILAAMAKNLLITAEKTCSASMDDLKNVQNTSMDDVVKTLWDIRSKTLISKDSVTYPANVTAKITGTINALIEAYEMDKKKATK
ncbi:MAG: hypothetical protein WCQ53_04465, partial [bacterium]